MTNGKDVESKEVIAGSESRDILIFVLTYQQVDFLCHWCFNLHSRVLATVLILSFPFCICLTFLH